jgi:HK97 family phage portal protein
MDKQTSLSNRIWRHLFSREAYTPPFQKGSLSDLVPNGGMSHRPDLADRVHLATWRSDDVQTSTGGAYSYAAATHTYTCYVWVNKAVRWISDNIAALPVLVSADGKPVDGHPLTELFSRVNDTMSSADLWRQWTMDMLLHGESALELVKAGTTYAEVWPRKPDVISIKPDPAKVRYYGVQGYKIEDGLGAAYTLPPEELIFFRFYNPSNPWRGISILSAVREGIKIDQLAQSWSSSFYEHGARPDYAITAPQGTTKTERDQLKAEMKAHHMGSPDEPIVLEDGVADIKTLSFPPKDMIWMEHRQMSRDEVAAIFGLPDVIMGFGNDSYDTEEKRRVAERAAWTGTLLPLLSFRDTNMTEYFTRYGLLKPGQRVETDTTGILSLRDKSQIFAYHIDAGITERNEVRASLGLEAQDDETLGAQLYTLKQQVSVMQLLVNAGFTPEQAAEMCSIEEVPEGQPPSSFGFTPEPFQIKAPEPQAEPARVKLAVPRGKTIELNSDEHKALYEEWITRAAPGENKFLDRLRGMLSAQQREVANRFENADSDAEAGKIAADPFDRGVWARKFGVAHRPIIRDITEQAGSAALEDVGVSLSFDLLNPRVIEFLRGREQRFAQAVTQTTWDALKDTLANGIELGESIGKLADRVTDTMELRKGQSAEAIARTENIGAASGGAIEGWTQSGVVEGKQWVATFDDRVRDTHAEAHGQTVGLDEDFEVGDATGPGPGQMDSAGESVNCRCAVVAVLSED